MREQDPALLHTVPNRRQFIWHCIAEIMCLPNHQIPDGLNHMTFCTAPILANTGPGSVKPTRSVPSYKTSYAHIYLAPLPLYLGIMDPIWTCYHNLDHDPGDPFVIFLVA
ncbi:unnamed protein product [Protopolystoma xenopodis]|uniref:Uncharacterized protein n=1 Tax=Protopolystoma xenopodis TaxID=117903 RepID=A0A3S5AYD6_9PLAT|nr:unnamed protein product [Protopolystoma xenopodis]